MKSFEQFLRETPTNTANAAGTSGGFGNDANSPVAGYDKRLFPAAIDDLSQDYQTPGQSGQAQWRFQNVYPVQKLTLADITSMVDASKEFVNRRDDKNQSNTRNNFN